MISGAVVKGVLTVGGTILVVLAGVWGFRHLISLLGSDSYEFDEQDAHFERCQGMTSAQRNDYYYGTRSSNGGNGLGW